MADFSKYQEKFIDLLQIMLGNHDIRYFCLSSECPTDANTMLFLGADILNGSTVSGKHWCRVHQRYAKEGLATKVEWKDAKILHIRNSSSLWFYSIQGLFKVAFELQDSMFQRDCLFLLRDAWVKRLKERPLPEKTSLTWEETMTGENVAVSLSVSASELSSLPVQSTSALQRQQIQTEACQESSFQNSILSVDNVTEVRNVTDQSFMTNSSSSQDVPCFSQEIVLVDEHASCSDILNTDPDTSYSLHVHVVSKQCSSGEINVDRFSSFLDKVIECAKSEWKVTEQSFSDVLNNLITVIQLIKCDLEAILSGTDTFPYSVIKEYVEVNQNDEERAKFAVPWLPVKRNIALTIFSEWVGKQNASLHHQINEKAEEFKLAHIGCIDDLPSAESIIDELFPSHMKLLLSTWMEHTAQEENIPEQPGAKRLKMTANSKGLLPFILLILEFANRTFISGVSHVVYAKLVHAS